MVMCASALGGGRRRKLGHKNGTEGGTSLVEGGASLVVDHQDSVRTRVRLVASRRLRREGNLPKTLLLDSSIDGFWLIVF